MGEGYKKTGYRATEKFVDVTRFLSAHGILPADDHEVLEFRAIKSPAIGGAGMVSFAPRHYLRVLRVTASTIWRIRKTSSGC